MKIVCLGNEFVEGDSLAKEVGALLSEKYDVVNVKDSFELMGIVSSVASNRHDPADPDPFVILDVVEGLEDVVRLSVEDLRVDGMVSAHDFDAAYVLRLLDSDIDIIGIPRRGDVIEVKNKVLEIITN